MTCREFVEFLLEYVSGELSEAERARFDQHLAECPDCVNYLATYEETIRLGKFCAEEEPLPDQVPVDLVQAILSARKRMS